MRSQWLVVLLVLPLVVSCQTAWRVAENPAFQTAFRSAVQFAVSEYVFSNESKQNESLRIVQKLQAHVDESEVVTVAELKNMTMQSIPWDALTFQERLELRGMIEAIAQHLQNKVGSGELEKNDQVEVKEFLSWIENAIHFAAK
jgi:hypothetical protein